MRGTPSAPERASIVVDGLKLEGATPGNLLFDSRRAELHARVQYGSWPHNPAIDLAVKLAAASAPTIHPMTAQPLDADILAVLHGMKDFDAEADAGAAARVAGGGRQARDPERAPRAGRDRSRMRPARWR